MGCLLVSWWVGGLVPERTCALSPPCPLQREMARPLMLILAWGPGCLQQGSKIRNYLCLYLLTSPTWIGLHQKDLAQGGGPLPTMEGCDL